MRSPLLVEVVLLLFDASPTWLMIVFRRFASFWSSACMLDTVPDSVSILDVNPLIGDCDDLEKPAIP